MGALELARPGAHRSSSRLAHLILDNCCITIPTTETWACRLHHYEPPAEPWPSRTTRLEAIPGYIKQATLRLVQRSDDATLILDAGPTQVQASTSHSYHTLVSSVCRHMLTSNSVSAGKVIGFCNTRQYTFDVRGQYCQGFHADLPAGGRRWGTMKSCPCSCDRSSPGAC